jgi:hypothetical protein
LSISDPLAKYETVFDKVSVLFNFIYNLLTKLKVKLMSLHIFTVVQELWVPGQDLAVDEIIECFTGRSSDIVTIPSKPIPTGYKV